MSDLVPSQQLQEGTSSTVTVVGTDEQTDDTAPTLHLKLRKPKTDRKVKWSTGTVDNEHMNRKKSKCCCIYDKPRQFGESSSSEDSEDECDHCHGHVEKKKKKKPIISPSEGDGNFLNQNDECIPTMEAHEPKTYPQDNPEQIVPSVD